MVYAFKNNSIRNSSSGAAFPTIAEALYAKLHTCINCPGGDNPDFVVYGAAFREDFTVGHQRAVGLEECGKFRGSKYVQSNLGDSFRQVKQDLIAGNIVLFTGTPCQIHAVKCYLKDTDATNLYLVDLICHGVPSERLWMDFIKWLESKRRSKITDFSFRYQNARWKQYPIMAGYLNGRRSVNTYELRSYIKLFFTDKIMRESCYTCKYANTNRPGDLTIGDFWGIESVMPDFPYRESVSEIIVNTAKGQEIIKEIEKLSRRQPDIVMEACLSEDYLKYQRNLNAPTRKPVDTEQFREDYKRFGYEYIIKKYTGYSWKGRIKHCVVRFLNEAGWMKPVSLFLHRNPRDR